MILPSFRNFLTLESFVYFLNLISFIFFWILTSFSLDETFISEKNRYTAGWVDKLSQDLLFFLFNYFAVQLIHLCILFAHTNYILMSFIMAFYAHLIFFDFIYLHYYLPIFFILLISSLFNQFPLLLSCLFGCVSLNNVV